MAGITPPALEAVALHKSFGGLTVARDVSLRLPVGARHALIGPNGAGKTTLIDLLTGALKPDSGEVRLAGTAVTQLSQQARVQRGLVRTFQINTLFPGLTPIEAVTIAVLERRGRTRRWLERLSRQTEAIDEAYQLLQRVGLAADCLRPTRELAYGKQRQLEIALALACRPRVLLLDEPAAGVPAAESQTLFELIAALPASLTVLFIEHDMELVFRFADRITVLESGRILCEGTPAAVGADPDVRRVYLGGAVHG